MRTHTILVGAIVVVVPALVAAEPAQLELRTPETAQVGDLVATPPNADDLVFARKVLPAAGIAGIAQSRIIYLNRKGITLRPGDDDSRTDHSSIVTSQRVVPAWNVSQANWDATVACFKNLWREFDVTVTDVDPGNVNHMEAVFGGRPGDIGLPAGVGGVSPFTSDCAIIENSIVFTFTSAFGQADPQLICEVMAQEVAHSYGLDHERLATDPMTYMQRTGNRTFKDQLVSCGEYSDRVCGIQGSMCRQKQNSVMLLRERAGIADAIAPTLAITSPDDGATVDPGFEVGATASDNIAVVSATLYVDGVAAGAVEGPGPYMFPTDAALATGQHAIKVEASDGKNVQSQSINVNVRKGGGGGGGGGGSGSGGGGGDDDGDGTSHTGCSTGTGAGLGFGLLALVVLRRRRAG